MNIVIGLTILIVVFIVNKYNIMKIIFAFIAVMIMSGCALNNDCAIRGAQFGYMTGAIKTNNVVMAHAYSLYSRVKAARFCD